VSERNPARYHRLHEQRSSRREFHQKLKQH
jgi:hypothetical protein